MPSSRSSPSPAPMARPVQLARLPPMPLSARLPLTPRRAVRNRIFEYKDLPGGYGYLLLELHAYDYAFVPAFAMRRCVLLARVSNRCPRACALFFVLRG